MNKEIKAKWIGALRSGSYTQGQDFLRHTDKFCCLGVLCDVIDPRKWRLSEMGSSDDYQGGRRYLAEPVSAFADLSHEHEAELMRMNDGGKTFAEIADYIESNL